MDSLEGLFECFEDLRGCVGTQDELLEALKYLYDWAPSSIRPHVVTSIYNLLVEEN